MSILAAAPQLRRLEIYRCSGRVPEVFDLIISLPNLQHLTIDYSVFVHTVVADLPAIPMPSLTSLTITCSNLHPYAENLYPLADILHLFPKLRKLVLFTGAAGPVVKRLLVNPIPLCIDTLIIRRSTRVDFALVRRFLEIHGSSIQRLSLDRMDVIPLTPIEQYLPSLRGFRGWMGAAETFVTPEVEEIYLTTEYYSMNIALRDLKILPFNQANLRRLELYITTVCIPELAEMLSWFFNLESLHLAGVSSYQKSVSLFIGFQSMSEIIDIHHS
jgi:hypothetical protein